MIKLNKTKKIKRIKKAKKTKRIKKIKKIKLKSQNLNQKYLKTIFRKKKKNSLFLAYNTNNLTFLAQILKTKSKYFLRTKIL